eukprot:2983446-Alexandrium_andersonii.AAC.1
MGVLPHHFQLQPSPSFGSKPQQETASHDIKFRMCVHLCRLEVAWGKLCDGTWGNCRKAMAGQAVAIAG